MDERLRWNRYLLDAVTRAQAHFVRASADGPLFEELLDAALALTDSSAGVLCVIESRTPGEHLLRVLARRAVDESSDAPPEAWLGELATRETPSISNDAACGFERYIAIPLNRDERKLGLLLLANRSDAYDAEVAREIEPLVHTCATAIQALKAEAERRHVESTLRFERSRLQVMLGGVADGVVTTDERGVLVSLNAAAERMLGYTQAELSGRSMEAILGRESKAMMRQFMDSYGTPDQLEILGVPLEFNLRRRNGMEFPVSLTAVEVESEGGKYFSSIFRDLTERHLADQEIGDLKSELERTQFGKMIGRSMPMRRLYENIAEIAAGDWSVLIEGETGVGKELIARAIHAASPRRDGPFVATNLAGMTDSLLGSQLFGHRQGAFTGAVRDQPGLFEATAGGTLFIDEIGDISESIQIALLRALEEREIVRLGETQPRKLDVRVLAASNRSLDQQAKSGRFRKDLLYRLRVARIHVAPLRERGDDIVLLAENFLAEARAKTGKAVVRFAPDVVRRLLAHDWPGNVRELRNAIDFSSIRCRGSTIQLMDLPPEFYTLPLDADRRGRARSTPDEERSRIADALRQSGGNRTRAARMLGISRATLYRKLDALGIRANA